MNEVRGLLPSNMSPFAPPTSFLPPTPDFFPTVTETEPPAFRTLLSPLRHCRHLREEHQRGCGKVSASSPFLPVSSQSPALPLSIVDGCLSMDSHLFLRASYPPREHFFHPGPKEKKRTLLPPRTPYSRRNLAAEEGREETPPDTFPHGKSTHTATI